MIMDSSVAVYFMITAPTTILCVTYQTLSVQLLKPPYDTKCQDYLSRSSELDLTLNRIQNDSVLLLNRSIPDVMLDTPLHTPVIFPHVLDRNASMLNIYESIVKKHRACMPKSCKLVNTIPRHYAVLSDLLGITVKWPDGFFIRNESRPKILLIDYLIFVCSCIGIWFGLSAYGSISFLYKLKGKFHPAASTGNGRHIFQLNRVENTRLNRIESKLDSYCRSVRKIEARQRENVRNAVDY